MIKPGRGLSFVLVLMLGMTLLGCVHQPNTPIPYIPEDKPDDRNATQMEVDAVIEANNRFAIDLYKRYSQQDGNIFFSPYSVSSAMAMVYEGSRGQTADEIQDVFHYPSRESLRKGFARLYNLLNDEGKPYELHTANALWAQKDYHFEQSYLNTVRNYYGGVLTNLDFARDPEGSRKTINSWVEEQTNGKIKDLLPGDSITPNTRLVLTNAIYFKGKWVKQFDPEYTRKQDFYVSPDKTVKVDMMYIKEHFNYTEDDEVQVLELPYDGDELSMLIILPKDKDGLSSVERSLTLEKVNRWREQLRKSTVEVQIPKFKLETKYRMEKDLADMGMPTAFIACGSFSGDSCADFSGMTGKRDLYIGIVIHKALVEVNEEGTEASAATAIALKEGGPNIEKVFRFRVDHPFIFIIQDREGTILFMGRMSDPP